MRGTLNKETGRAIEADVREQGGAISKTVSWQGIDEGIDCLPSLCIGAS